MDTNTDSNGTNDTVYTDLQQKSNEWIVREHKFLAQTSADHNEYDWLHQIRRRQINEEVERRGLNLVPLKVTLNVNFAVPMMLVMPDVDSVLINDPHDLNEYKVKFEKHWAQLNPQLREVFFERKMIQSSGTEQSDK